VHRGDAQQLTVAKLVAGEIDFKTVVEPVPVVQPDVFALGTRNGSQKENATQ
jgi:hypothetical protein